MIWSSGDADNHGKIVNDEYGEENNDDDIPGWKR